MKRINLNILTFRSRDEVSINTLETLTKRVSNTLFEQHTNVIVGVKT